MSKALFLRLLDTPISEKGDRLRQQIADLNADIPTADTFPVELSDFSDIPSSPFAYWVGGDVRNLFTELNPFESEDRTVKVGLQTGDDNRFVRLWWEVQVEKILDVSGSPAWKDDIETYQNWCLEKVENGKIWVLFAKGGTFSPFYADTHLVVNWTGRGSEIANAPGSVIRNSEFYYRPGLTYSDRTSTHFAPRIMPPGVIISVKGSAAYSNNEKTLWNMLGVMNSKPFSNLMDLLVGTTSIAKSYQVGTIGRVPYPAISDNSKLSEIVGQCFELSRSKFTSNETTHEFFLPALVKNDGLSWADKFVVIAQSDLKRQNEISSLQGEIDKYVSELYGISELIDSAEMSLSVEDTTDFHDNLFADEDDGDEETNYPITNPHVLTSDLLMWCVGIAFGRWDVRYALHPETLPALPEPFDPLPVCSPGMLKGANGLPLGDSPQGYPLPVAWRGYLVDDPDRPQDDIVHAVQAVIHLLWGDQAEAVEKEACQILQVPDLRAWFRDPKGFFAWHIKRYSKSRRKAPLYWLAQSAKKNFAIWLYYPRLNPDSLFFAAREYGDAKLNFESAHLEDQQAQLRALGGSNPKAQEKKIAVQAALVAELQTFLKKLDSAALLSLKPDLNDGVLLNLAPLREIVPWKEPARVWDELLRGKYEWSAIAAQLRQKGLVKKA